jgi:predicted  nucleic acid-binding Zn-ribbon protein
MNNEEGNSLERLHKVAQLDQRIARVVAERRKQLSGLQELSRLLEEARVEFDEATKKADLVRQRYDQEQREIKVEREKLKGRRKALATFNNHKVQQSALVEIERNERIISAREESLFAIVDSLDEVEANEKRLRNLVEERQLSVRLAQENGRQECSSLESQFKEARREREEILASVPDEIRIVYNSVYEKFPADAVVKVEKGNCSGCFMVVPPQALVDMLDGAKGIVKCRGCGRLLVSEKI